MPAINQDVTFWAGNSGTITVGPILDGEGNIVDLTGASARWWMAKSATATGADIYIQKNGVSLSNETDGWRAVVTLEPADTKTVKPNTLYHECEITDASGNISTVMTGKFTLKPSLIAENI